MQLLLTLALAVDVAVLTKLESPFSGEREKGAYALGRLHEPLSRDDRSRVDQAVLGGASGQLRAAALRGLCDRSWPDGFPRAGTEVVVRALEDRDPAAVAAAAECTERFARDRGVKVLAAELDTRRGDAYVLPLIAIAGRLGEPALREVTTAAADRLGFRVTAERLVLDANRTRVFIALAALGTDLEPTVEASATPGKKEKEEKPDFLRDARVNAIRAAAGNEEALAKLVETANVADDLHLRREALDLLFLLPPAPRAKALRGVESRIADTDPGVRARVVRELSRAAGSADAWIEPVLVKASKDFFPDLRLQALCGLADRRVLSDEARAALAAKDDDPLVAAALRAVHALAAPAPSPTPSASPSPSPESTPAAAASASPEPSSPPAPTPTRTPYRYRR